MSFINLLKQYNIKITTHKLAILELLNQFRHLDANQIIAKLHQQKSSISSATVYRILAHLEQHQILIKHNFGNNQAIYELNHQEQHHDHLICLDCGAVIEFNHQEIENMQLEIAQQNKFTMISHNLNIYGYCNTCTDLKTCS
jgi:Fur family ferric uptake transcriptional regulator